MASYYACSWGQALDAVVPAGVKAAAGMALRTVLVVPDEVRFASALPELKGKQADAFAVLLRAAGPLTPADVCRLAKCGPGPIQALRRARLVHTAKTRISKELGPVETDLAAARAGPHIPSAEQSQVLDALSPALEADAFAPFLLHGVTGSGKTEVYLSAIERVVARGREAIALVPEISLTPQTIRRFQRRFDRVAVLHSHMSDAQRHRHWRALASGDVSVVVGARSAVFAPARRLGLIVIDEEHEGSFKQDSVPRYHARDVAVKRAQLLGIPVILGSATPALETWHNATAGRYTRLSLTERVQGRPMPEVALVDMRHEKPEPGRAASSISAPLEHAMREALEAGGQVMLFLNRRGFHTFILCPSCGAVCKCGACDVALTFHRARNRALCHTCDAESPPPDRCAACGHAKLHYGGIGTERLERDVKNLFADRVVRRMDSDTMRAIGSHQTTLDAFRGGQIDILLGTQMIAKGLDFPEVTLVGVVNADTALHLPDFRAAERTFQLVAQVAGRTGRGEKPGRVVVQSYCPDEPAIGLAAAHDYTGFVAQELQRRKLHGLPPFGRVVRLVARGEDPGEVEGYLGRVAQSLEASAPEGVRWLGPAPAPVAKIRNLSRFHIQLRSPSSRAMIAAVRAALAGAGPPKGVELAIDVDPVSML
jgi:primosomal protein N' (replication factor Y)